MQKAQITAVGGPMFEPARHDGMQKITESRGTGAHYSIWHLDSENGRANSEIGMNSLRDFFPNGEANGGNFVLFSTSGIHGKYTTIEEIEASLMKYGEGFDPGDEDYPDDWAGSDLTVLIVQPRIVCLRCGNVKVRLADIPYLKQLRASSWKAVATIGTGDQ